MVSEDLYEQVSVFEFRTPVFKTVNNDQKFLIVNVIITFCWYHALVVECYWVKNSLIVILREDSTCHKVRDVCL